MHLRYQCGTCDDECLRYYTKQAGTGLPVYTGAQYQRGHGIFSSIFRHVIPFLKKAGIGIGKNLLRTGNNILTDVETGQSLSNSLKRRAKELPEQLLTAMTGGGASSPKKKHIKSSTKEKHIKRDSLHKKKVSKSKSKKKKSKKSKKQKKASTADNFFTK